MGSERAGLPQARPPVLATRVGVLATAPPGHEPS
jgi:hypothetical protein